MNEAQLKAAKAVEHHRDRVRMLGDLASETRHKLDAAQRTLRRAEAKLRKEAEADPQAWHAVTPVPT